jgi:hypothetical protein
MKRFIFLVVFLMLILSACGADPRKEADAYETRSQADQAAATAEQERRFATERHAYDMAQEAYWQQVYLSTTETAKRVANVTVWLAGFAIAVGLSGLILSLAWTAHNTTRGLGEAAVRAAIVKANLIYLDKNTGHFPVFLYEGHGRGQLVNANVNGALPMDTRHEPDRQMIANSGAILVASMVAREAAKSQDPAGVSVIRPQTIDVTSEMVDYAKILEEARRDE